MIRKPQYPCARVSDWPTRFSYKETFYKEPTCRRPKYLKSFCYATKNKIPKELFDMKIFNNWKHQELKSRFHSFAANTRIDCLLSACQVLH